MPKQRRARTIPQYLPPYDGPKLQRFRYHNFPIQWLGRLDDDRDEGSGTQGFVFHVKINDREYALKVFKFWDPESAKYFWGPYLGRSTPLDTAAYCMDPFYAECRAYGRIEDAIAKKKLRRDVTVPCYGFMHLQEADERMLESFDVDLELDTVDPIYQQSTIGGYKVRAIVKHLASSEHGVNSKSLARILSGIKQLNANKIYNRDIRQDNYKDSKIIDFGSSWTEPHGILDKMQKRAAESTRMTDKVQFDQMVMEEEIPNPKGYRGMPDSKYKSKLRPQKGEKQPGGSQEAKTG
ncbi:hypothetical protein S7711_10811 [Stachybotrys chartarum IBT 7711]|uniref:Protein kinase domain-containing protein n=1 Tax=Stachybotrys chartarum (strain CBS 109288 / IBT 7711) TaxID=1280523 RepID=A0A084AR82_STACB|nr:hypothetical protein S7711_10811 [Stachybotrys chartarum IBT 7711]